MNDEIEHCKTKAFCCYISSIIFGEIEKLNLQKMVSTVDDEISTINKTNTSRSKKCFV